MKRLLRALAARGVFAELRDGRFSLTPLSESLRVDAPNSARGIVLFWGDPLHWDIGAVTLLGADGPPAIEKIRGKPAFDWLPEVARARSGVQRRHDEYVDDGDTI